VQSTSPTDAEIETVLGVLSETPIQIAHIARGLTPKQLHRKPETNAWSEQEIVAHLRACADVWGGTIDRMLTEDEPTLRYVSPRGWIKKTDYLQQDFHESLRVFSQLRASLVETLSGLDKKGWLRRATFTGTARPRGHRSELCNSHRRSRGTALGPASPNARTIALAALIPELRRDCVRQCYPTG